MTQTGSSGLGLGSVAWATEVCRRPQEDDAPGDSAVHYQDRFVFAKQAAR